MSRLLRVTVVQVLKFGSPSVQLSDLDVDWSERNDCINVPLLEVSGDSILVDVRHTADMEQPRPVVPPDVRDLGKVICRRAVARIAELQSSLSLVLCPIHFGEPSLCAQSLRGAGRSRVVAKECNGTPACIS